MEHNLEIGVPVLLYIIKKSKSSVSRNNECLYIGDEFQIWVWQIRNWAWAVYWSYSFILFFIFFI